MEVDVLLGRHVRVQLAPVAVMFFGGVEALRTMQTHTPTHPHRGGFMGICRAPCLDQLDRGSGAILEWDNRNSCVYGVRVEVHMVTKAPRCRQRPVEMEGRIVLAWVALALAHLKLSGRAFVMPMLTHGCLFLRSTISRTFASKGKATI